MARSAQTSAVSGARDRRIRLDAATQAAGRSGSPVTTWTPLGYDWSSKRDASGRERFAAGQDSASMDTVFQIRYRADMDPELVDVATLRRVVYLGRAFNIVFVRMLDRDVLELTTLAGRFIETPSP